jgi:hypothetical protein
LLPEQPQPLLPLFQGWMLMQHMSLGVLHDIGRRAGVMDMYHILTGYRYLMELGYPAAARICLTHCFPLQDIRSVGSNWDGTPKELDFVAAYIERLFMMITTG